MTLTQENTPQTAPVTLPETKAFLQIGYDGEDELVTTLIAAATAQIEADAGLPIIERTYSWRLDTWPGDALGVLELPIGPIRSLISIQVMRGDPPSSVDVTSEIESVYGKRKIYLKGSSWPQTDLARGGIIIRFEAGLAAGQENVPDDIRLAVKLSVLQTYREREGSTTADVSERISDLLAPWRRIKL